MTDAVVVRTTGSMGGQLMCEGGCPTMDTHRCRVQLETYHLVPETLRLCSDCATKEREQGRLRRPYPAFMRKPAPEATPEGSEAPRDDRVHHAAVAVAADLKRWPRGAPWCAMNRLVGGVPMTRVAAYGDDVGLLLSRHKILYRVNTPIPAPRWLRHTGKEVRSGSVVERVLEVIAAAPAAATVNLAYIVKRARVPKHRVQQELRKGSLDGLFVKTGAEVATYRLAPGVERVA